MENLNIAPASRGHDHHQDHPSTPVSSAAHCLPSSGAHHPLSTSAARSSEPILGVDTHHPSRDSPVELQVSVHPSGLPEHCPSAGCSLHSGLPALSGSSRVSGPSSGARSPEPYVGLDTHHPSRDSPAELQVSVHPSVSSPEHCPSAARSEPRHTGSPALPSSSRVSGPSSGALQHVRFLPPTQVITYRLSGDPVTGDFLHQSSITVKTGFAVIPKRHDLHFYYLKHETGIVKMPQILTWSELLLLGVVHDGGDVEPLVPLVPLRLYRFDTNLLGRWFRIFIITAILSVGMVCAYFSIFMTTKKGEDVSTGKRIVAAGLSMLGAMFVGWIIVALAPLPYAQWILLGLPLSWYDLKQVPELFGFAEGRFWASGRRLPRQVGEEGQGEDPTPG